MSSPAREIQMSIVAGGLVRLDARATNAADQHAAYSERVVTDHLGFKTKTPLSRQQLVEWIAKLKRIAGNSGTQFASRRMKPARRAVMYSVEELLMSSPMFPVPENAQLELEASIEHKDAGFLFAGQKVFPLSV